MSIFAPRMSRFKPSPSQIASTRVRELQAEGRDIVKLTAGEPDFPTPDHAKAAVIELMDRNEIHYTPINGLVQMREAARLKFRRDNGLEYGLDQIAVGSGTKQILFNALMATVSAGDEVIVPAPYWASYPDMVQLAGGTPVIVACGQNSQFKMRPEQLAEAITDKTKWLIFSSPSNPTGATYSAAELKALAAVLLEHPHVHILSDDVYEHLIYDKRTFATFAQVEPQLYDRTVTCNGVAQAAAIAALEGPQEFVAERTANLQYRRDILFEKLNAAAGLSCDLPEGAMYIFCSCAGAMGKKTPDGKVLETDTDFTMYLLDTVGVAVVQGAAYGLSPYFRASFVAPEDDLRRGGDLIQQACAALQ